MNVNMDELLETLQKVYSENSKLISWDGEHQWMLESTRQRMKRDQAVNYDNLRTLNQVSGAARAAHRGSALQKKLQDLVAHERKVSKAIIKQLDAEIKTRNIAYWVVTSSMLLEHELFWWDDSGEASALLRNRKGRWYTTDKITENYINAIYRQVNHRNLSEDCGIKSGDLYRGTMTKLAVEGGFTDCRIYGRAIIALGANQANTPVFVSVDCEFDLDGNITGIPADFGWRVLMFRPYRKTVVTDLRPGKRIPEDG